MRSELVQPKIVKPWPGITWEREAFTPGAEVIERPCASEAELMEAVQDADVLLADIATPVTARVIAAAPHLRAIMCYASGVDHVDLSAATARGIYVINTAGYSTIAVAEHTLALMFGLARKLLSSHREAANVSWRAWPPLRGFEITGKALGIIGLGAIGRTVAEKGAALGMRVLTHSRNGRVAGGLPVELDTLLAQADVVSLHCALTPERVHLIGARELKLMRPTAVLLNTARGALIDDDALVHALREGWILGAGLDVLEREPPPPDHPLLSLENVIVTPHNAYNTHEADDRFRSIIQTQVRMILAGHPPDFLVNREILTKGDAGGPLGTAKK